MFIYLYYYYYYYYYYLKLDSGGERGDVWNFESQIQGITKNVIIIGLSLESYIIIEKWLVSNQFGVIFLQSIMW